MHRSLYRQLDKQLSFDEGMDVMTVSAVPDLSPSHVKLLAERLDGRAVATASWYFRALDTWRRGARSRAATTNLPLPLPARFKSEES